MRPLPIYIFARGTDTIRAFCELPLSDVSYLLQNPGRYAMVRRSKNISFCSVGSLLCDYIRGGKISARGARLRCLLSAMCGSDWCGSKTLGAVDDLEYATAFAQKSVATAARLGHDHVDSGLARITSGRFFHHHRTGRTPLLPPSTRQFSFSSSFSLPLLLLACRRFRFVRVVSSLS